MQIIAEWTVQHGPVFKWSLANVELLVVTDPVEVAKLASKQLDLPKAKQFYELTGNVRVCLWL